ncbi:MAG: BLUF domain-containing protein [Betaproteobacteria bacterium]|nr:MAG: BLUF domain-containing protein [Betaproteobacteria bacterium]
MLSLLTELIYISELAPTARLTQVADVLNRARANNQVLHVTGILVFDGLRFVQHLEGEQSVVMQLFRRIQQDTRHTNVRWLHDSLIENRRFDAFFSGYWHDDSPDGAIASLQNYSGVGLRSALHSRIGCFDLVS